MALTPIDRQLLDRCLDRAPGAWNDFVDRFSGLFVHVIRHTAESRSIAVSAADEEEILAEVFLAVLADNDAVLRRFAGRSSLATYLAVIARRVAVRELVRRRRSADEASLTDTAVASPEDEQTQAAREVVDQLLNKMTVRESNAVRMAHLEGRPYRDIAASLGVSENSVGSILSRARRSLLALNVRLAAARS